MASAPDWKVYSEEGEYVAACKYIEDAAALVSFRGDGATVRYGHTKAWTVWTEGSEDQPAGESYNHVATVAHARLQGFRDAVAAKNRERVKRSQEEWARRQPTKGGGES